MNSSLFKTLYSSVLLGKNLHILLTYLVFNVQFLFSQAARISNTYFSKKYLNVK